MAGNYALMLLLAAITWVVGPGEVLAPSTPLTRTLYGPLLILVATGMFVGGSAAMIFYLRWFHCFVRVARAIRIEPGATPGWAVGYWFIPIVNLYRPYQVVRAIAEGLGGPDLARSAGVTAWWVLWIVGSVAEAVATRPIGESPFTALGTVANLLNLLAVLLAIRVVRALDRALQARRQRAEDPLDQLRP